MKQAGHEESANEPREERAMDMKGPMDRPPGMPARQDITPPARAPAAPVIKGATIELRIPRIVEPIADMVDTIAPRIVAMPAAGHKSSFCTELTNSPVS